MERVQAENNDKIWTLRSKILILILSISHIVVLSVYLTNVVWVVNWESSKLIASGIPMYEQSGSIPVGGGNSHEIPPQHFPLYFYFMAGLIKIFGSHPMVGRMAMWVFTVLNFYLVVKIIEPETDRELQMLSIIYYLDPLLVTINLSGKHDQITMTFILLGILLIKENHPVLAALSFSLGVMTKFFPIFGAIVGLVYYLKRKKWNDLAKYTITGIGSFIIMFGYFWWTWRDQFLDVIFYQAKRLNRSLSVWYYLIPENIDRSLVLGIQAFVYLTSFIYLLSTDVEKDHITVILGVGFLSSVFVVFSTQYYTSYAYYFMLPALLTIIPLYRANKYKWIWIIILFYAMQNFGNILCYGTCWPSWGVFTWYSPIGLILIFIGSVWVIYYYHKFILRYPFTEDPNSV